LASFAYQILPYCGFGSGIIRALENYPDIEFIDDRDGSLFKCIIWRRKELGVKKRDDD
jgi:ATP-dependent DNA helicase RecG